MEVVTPDQIPTGLSIKDRGYAIKVRFHDETLTWNGEQWCPTVDGKAELLKFCPYAGMRCYIVDVEHEFDGDEWLIV